jgi:hypothetical protein
VAVLLEKGDDDRPSGDDEQNVPAVEDGHREHGVEEAGAGQAGTDWPSFRYLSFPSYPLYGAMSNMTRWTKRMRLRP